MPKEMHTYYRSLCASLFRIFFTSQTLFFCLAHLTPSSRLGGYTCIALFSLLLLVPLSLNADKEADKEADKKTKQEELCHYRFHLPPKARLFSQKQNLLIAKAKYGSGYARVGIQWLFSCTENLRRTSQSSENYKKKSEQRKSFSITTKTCI